MNMRRGTCMLDEHKHKTRQLLTKVSIEKKFEISKAVARNIKEKKSLNLGIMGYIYDTQTERKYLNFSLSNFYSPEKMTSNKFDFLEDKHSTIEKKIFKMFLYDMYFYYSSLNYSPEMLKSFFT